MAGRILLGLALAGFLWILVRHRRGQEQALLVIAVVFPFLYAASWFSLLFLEPRYLVLLAPVTALLLGRAFRERIAVAGLVGALLFSVAGLIVMQRENRWPARAPDVSVPADLSPLLGTLERLRVDRASANYWLAYRISFESRERIIATPNGKLVAEARGLVTESSSRYSRYAPYERAVREDERAAHVYLAGSSAEAGDRPIFERAGYRRIASGTFVVYVPPRPLPGG